MSETALAQRLVRAKRKIRDAGIAYTVPASDSISERLNAVFTVIYLIFNEGYAASSGTELLRTDLCREAIRLARELVNLLKLEMTRSARGLNAPLAEALGLLALLLLHDARSPARVDSRGHLVVLDEQDRTLWRQEAIREGAALLDEALALRSPGAYQIQAAISALHGAAAHAGDTDWVQIAALYGALRRYRDTPVVRLNQIAAIAMADGPWRGLQLLDALQQEQALDNYYPLYAARAELLRRAGCFREAGAAYEAAIARCNTETERRYLTTRLHALKEDGPRPP
jgi:RNA polymerase sigma-70 factor (ECF subfamily)